MTFWEDLQKIHCFIRDQQSRGNIPSDQQLNDAILSYLRVVEDYTDVDEEEEPSEATLDQPEEPTIQAVSSEAASSESNGTAPSSEPAAALSLVPHAHIPDPSQSVLTSNVEDLSQIIQQPHGMRSTNNVVLPIPSSVVHSIDNVVLPIPSSATLTTPVTTATTVTITTSTSNQPVRTSATNAITLTVSSSQATGTSSAINRTLPSTAVSSSRPGSTTTTSPSSTQPISCSTSSVTVSTSSVSSGTAEGATSSMHQTTSTSTQNGQNNGEKNTAEKRRQTKKQKQEAEEANLRKQESDELTAKFASLQAYVCELERQLKEERQLNTAFKQEILTRAAPSSTTHQGFSQFNQPAPPQFLPQTSCTHKPSSGVTEDEYWYRRTQELQSQLVLQKLSSIEEKLADRRQQRTESGKSGRYSTPSRNHQSSHESRTSRSRSRSRSRRYDDRYDRTSDRSYRSRHESGRPSYRGSGSDGMSRSRRHEDKPRERTPERRHRDPYDRKQRREAHHYTHPRYENRSDRPNWRVREEQDGRAHSSRDVEDRNRQRTSSRQSRVFDYNHSGSRREVPSDEENFLGNSPPRVTRL